MLLKSELLLIHIDHGKGSYSRKTIGKVFETAQSKILGAVELV